MKKYLFILMLLSSCSLLQDDKTQLIKLVPPCTLQDGAKVKLKIAQCANQYHNIKSGDVLEQRKLLNKKRTASQLEKDAIEYYAGESLETAFHICVQSAVIQQCGDIWMAVHFKDSESARFLDCRKLPILSRRGMATQGAAKACESYRTKE
jgi:hypothetical protein